MTDSYKVQTSQLPNFPDENTKRDEKQENFFLPPDLFRPFLPPFILLPASSRRLSLAAQQY